MRRIQDTNSEYIDATLWTDTERQGHGKEIAEGLDVEAYDALVIFSGDGLLYEAVNGFCERKDALTALKSCPLAALPGGESRKHKWRSNRYSAFFLGRRLGQRNVRLLTRP